MKDWKDALSALSGVLPEDNSPAKETSTEETGDTQIPPKPKKLPKLQYFFEKKGRAGKPATIIAGFGNMTDEEISDIARTLKQKLGCGGSSRGGEILLQGDRRSQSKEILSSMGFK